MEIKNLKIKERNVNDLIGAEYNPRKLSAKQKSDLTDSLKRFGFVDPIIVNMHKDRENIVIGGHSRLKVAKDIGLEKVPCVELNLNLDQEKELNIRLNKNTGEFDFEMLKNEFEEELLIEWGFEEWEVNSGEDEVDYGILDDEDLDEELGEMTDNVKRAIQIEFDGDDYEEAQSLVKKCRDNDIYIGGLIIEKLKSVEL